MTAAVRSLPIRVPLPEAWLRLRRWIARLVFFATGGLRGAEEAGISTPELIRRFQRGQPLMFEALFDRYKDYVYRVAFFTLRHAEEAEDATQETFLDVLRGLPDYDVNGSARFETWLYRVTVNRCKMRLRRRQLPSEEWGEVEERLEQLPNSDEEALEANLERRESEADLWRAVGRLSEEHRAVLLLRYLQDCSYDEIAAALGLNLGTVKSRLFNAHRKLKELLGTTGMEV